MSRLWLGVGLLIFLLVLGLVLSALLTTLEAPLQDLLTDAGEAALAGDWEKAEKMSREARAHWDKYWKFCAAVTDHGPMEQMDSGFAALQVYLHQREEGEFAAQCGELSQMAKALGEVHRLSWWNLL